MRSESVVAADAPLDPLEYPDVNDVLADRYRLLKRIGTGGMGIVFEARDFELEETVALKLVHPRLVANAKYREQLRREVRIARRVSHPNVCRVHDLGQHGRRLFVTMELLRGRSLRHLLDFPDAVELSSFSRRLDLILQVCRGLSAAHAAGVLHRDVKPDNIIVELPRAVLTDFGIASHGGDRNRKFVGTLNYAAPEILQAEPYDERADVYSLAVTTWELLAGRRPFERSSLTQALLSLEKGIPLPDFPAGTVPHQVVRGIMKLLRAATEIRPEGRTRDAAMFARQLSEAARPASFVTEVSDIVGDTQPPATGDQLSVTAQPTHPSSHPSHDFERGTTTIDTFGALSSVHLITPTLRVATILTMHWDSDAAPSLMMSSDGARWTLTGNLSEAVERIVIDAGGTMLSVDEGRLTSIFGAPVAIGDDVARAARAAQLLLKEQTTGSVGIDTGRVLVRESERSPGFEANGEPVANADELARQAASGEIRVSAAAARHLVGHFEQELIESGGKRTYVLGEAHDSDRTRRSPLVGRDVEVAALQKLITDGFAERRLVHATIVAPRGLGKTRLRVELESRVAETRDVKWLTARSSPIGARSPYALIGRVWPSWLTAVTDAAMQGKAPVEAARRWLEKRAATRPLVIALEDIQWADRASLDLILELINGFVGGPVAILAFARGFPTEGEPRWLSACANSENPGLTIQLGPLRGAAAEQIARLHAPAATDDSIQNLLERAEGQPYFIEELARDLQERLAAGHTPTLSLPTTIEAVLQTRLDRLSNEERELAAIAAVIGKVFDRDALDAGVAESQLVSPIEIDELLMALERRAVVHAVPPEGLEDERYAFKHVLVRDVAYQQLPPRPRRRYHAAIARYLQEHARHSEDHKDHETIFEIAHHLDAAGARTAAQHAYHQAGELALRFSAWREARRALERAVALAGTPDADLLELLGDALVTAESSEAGLAVYLNALKRTSLDTPSARLHRKVGRCMQLAGDNQRAVDWYRRGLALLKNQPIKGDPRELAALKGALGWVLGYSMGETEEGLRLGEESVGLLEGTRWRRELARGLSKLGANYMRAGRWRDQLACNQRNLEIAQELADLDLQCTALINLGVVHASLGELAEAIAHTKQAIAIALRTGAHSTVALARSNLVGLRLDRDRESADLVKLERQLKAAISLGERCGARSFLPEAWSFMARIHLLNNQQTAAEHAAQRAVDLAVESASHHDEGTSLRVLGGVLSLMNRFDEADQALSRSHELLDAMDLFEDARTALVRARFLRRRSHPGDRDKATTLQSAAKQVFESHGAAWDLELIDTDWLR